MRAALSGASDGSRLQLFPQMLHQYVLKLNRHMVITKSNSHIPPPAFVKFVLCSVKLMLCSVKIVLCFIKTGAALSDAAPISHIIIGNQLRYQQLPEQTQPGSFPGTCQPRPWFRLQLHRSEVPCWLLKSVPDPVQRLR